MRTIAIIPARGNSKRLPGKNIQPLNGKPMAQYTIEAAIKSDLFDEVIVSTESQEVADALKDTGAVFRMRSPDLSTDTSTVWQVCLDVLKDYSEVDTLCVLLPTSPLRTAADLRAAYEIYESNDCDCVMSVTEFEHPIQHAVMVVNEKVFPYDGAAIYHKRQDIQALYYHNGAIIIVDVAKFRERQEFYGLNTLAYVMPRERSIDVNTEYDFRVAEMLLEG